MDLPSDVLEVLVIQGALAERLWEERHSSRPRENLFEVLQRATFFERTSGRLDIRAWYDTPIHAADVANALVPRWRELSATNCNKGGLFARFASRVDAYAEGRVLTVSATLDGSWVNATPHCSN